MIDTVFNEYELARDNEASIAQLMSAATNSTMNMNEKFIQYQNLERKVDTSRQIYEALISRIKRAAGDRSCPDRRGVDAGKSGHSGKAGIPKQKAQPHVWFAARGDGRHWAVYFHRLPGQHG